MQPQGRRNVWAVLCGGIAVGLIGACIRPALAERPMIVDDASTLSLGASKVEFGWGREPGARRWEASVGTALTDTVEVAVGAMRHRASADGSAVSWYATGLGLKWVPMRFGDVSFGARLDATQDHHIAGVEEARTVSASLLASWWVREGLAAHANVGRNRTMGGDETQWATAWALGGDAALGAGWTVTLEQFGASQSKPGQQLGLRYEVMPGLKLSTAWGRQGGATIGNAGIA